MGDIHVMDKPPVNCTETYTEDIVELLEQVAVLERELDVDAVVWAGDIFDHKHPARNSHNLVIKMIETVRKYRNLWILAGNHDLMNDRLETLDTHQPLGVLYAAGAQKLDGWHEDLPLMGIPWQQDWDDALKTKFSTWTDSDRDLDKCLLVTHVSMFPPALADGVPYEHIPAADFSRSMGGQGSMYYGHIHDYHGQFTVDGVQYSNVGAISRGSLTESHLNRKVLVAVWDSEGGDNKFTEVELKYRPASEVFRVQHAEEKKAVNTSLEEFVKAIGTQTLDISSTASIIDHINTMPVEKKVRTKAISFIDSVNV